MLDQLKPPHIQGPSRLERSLVSVRRRLRLVTTVRGSSLTLAIILTLCLLSLGLDRLFRLGVPARSVCLMVYFGLAIYFTYRWLALPLSRPLSLLQVADRIEKLNPKLSDLIRSALSFNYQPLDSNRTTQLLVEKIKNDGESKAEEIRRVPIIKRWALIKSLLIFLGFSSLTGVILNFSPSDTLSTWWHRNVLLSQDHQWPYKTRLKVLGLEDGVLKVPRGDALSIEIEVEGEPIDRASIEMLFADGRRNFSLNQTGVNSFIHVQTEVREPFKFEVLGGDFRSKRHEVVVLSRPKIESLSLLASYPDYLRREPDTLSKPTGEIVLPFGTSVKFVATTTKPLQTLRPQKESLFDYIQIDPNNPQKIIGAFTPKENSTLTFSYIDVEGVIPIHPTQLQVRLEPDKAPTVKLTSDGVGNFISPNAKIPLNVQARDDYLISQLHLLHQQNKELNSLESSETEPETKSGSLKIPEFKETPFHQSQFTLEVESLKAEAGTRLSLQAQATDSDTLTGPKSTTTQSLEFKVVTEKELMDHFLRRQEEQHTTFSRVLIKQREARDKLYEAMDTELRQNGELQKTTLLKLKALTQTQRQLSARSKDVSKALQRVLNEMKNNRVGQAKELNHLGQKVIEPLDQLAQDQLPELGKSIDDLKTAQRGSHRVSQALEVAEELENSIEDMESILSAMSKLEDFTEIVNRLRDLIQVQGDSRDALEKHYKKILEDFFEEDDIFDDEP